MFIAADDVIMTSHLSG